MDCIELSNEATKFDSDLQYLGDRKGKKMITGRRG